MGTEFNRANPSPRYRSLHALYSQMHREGERTLGLAAEDTFPGQSLLPHVARIKRLIVATGAGTVLDYGSGKGAQYRPRPIVIDGARVADSVAEFWDVDEVRCYDPAYPPHAALPQGRFGGVVCTDVLEHCPEEDIGWILGEIFAFAEKFVYLNVACFAARKTLPNGENAHITVRAPEWWQRLVAAAAQARPDVVWELHAVAHKNGKASETLYGSHTAGESERDSIVTALVEGRPARFVTSNEMTRWRVETLYSKEPVTIEWLRTMPLGAVFLDVGANVGMYTIFAGLAREARVYAFEPESRNYAALNANIRLNDLAARVTAVCAGLSDHNGIETLHLGADFAGASCHSLGAEVGFDLKPRPAAFAQGAIAMRYDDLVAAGQMPVPQFVKIDVDGFEHKVLRGMERTLRNPGLKTLLVELNPALPEHRAAREQLESLGFACDPEQVRRAARTSGPFKGVAEHVFSR